MGETSVYEDVPVQAPGKLRPSCDPLRRPRVVLHQDLRRISVPSFRELAKLPYARQAS